MKALAKIVAHLRHLRHCWVYTTKLHTTLCKCVFFVLDQSWICLLVEKKKNSFRSFSCMWFVLCSKTLKILEVFNIIFKDTGLGCRFVYIFLNLSFSGLACIANRNDIQDDGKAEDDDNYEQTTTRQ